MPSKLEWAIAEPLAQDVLIARESRTTTRRWFRAFRWGVVIALVFGVARLVSPRWFGSTQNGIPERVEVVTRGDVVRDLVAQGRTLATQSGALNAVDAGTVTFEVRIGDQVEKGQILATVDSPELRSRLVQEDASLDALEASASKQEVDTRIAVAGADRQVEESRLDMELALEIHESHQRGRESGIYSDLELRRVAQQLSKARVAYDQSVKHARLQREMGLAIKNDNRSRVRKQRAVVEELNRQVKKLVVRAPYSGMIGQFHLDNGSHSAAGQALVTVVNPEDFAVNAAVPEGIARELVANLPAKISHRGHDYPGHVESVSPEVVGGEVEATVRFDRDHLPKELKQNERVLVRVFLQRRQGVLRLPKSAVPDTLRVTSIEVWNEGQREKRQVELGLRSQKWVEILDGAKVGEQVILPETSQSR